MSIKILHTSDWHIGKELHKVELAEDMERFFSWLIDFIDHNQVDVLLMSGDLFDQANPTQMDMKQYYAFLEKMIPLNCRIVLTGGNHDSPAVLNAPKDLLQLLKIDVVGGAPETVEELFVEYHKEDESVVIAAVPFLRDKDIRKSAPGETYNDKIEQIRDGLKTYFENVNAHYKANHEGKPFVIMGHLYAQGAMVSESERDIQIGNQAGVDSSIFGDQANYVALGHIHKPQEVGQPNIRYCGSPIALSFSEKYDQKEIVLLEFDAGTMTQTRFDIPMSRKLVLFEDTLENIRQKLAAYTTDSPLTDLAEIIVREEEYSLSVMEGLEQLRTEISVPGLSIIKSKVEFDNQQKGLSTLLATGTLLSELAPEELFKKRLELEPNLENEEDLLNAFREIMEQFGQNEN
jgi:exonuclease SbcD